MFVVFVCVGMYCLYLSLLVVVVCVFFFFKQKTAYEMRISDWSSDVCSSDLREVDLFVEYVDHLDGRLDVHAECLYADDGGAQYAFRVEHRGRLLCRGRAAVIHPSS